MKQYFDAVFSFIVFFFITRWIFLGLRPTPGGVVFCAYQKGLGRPGSANSLKQEGGASPRGQPKPPPQKRRPTIVQQNLLDFVQKVRIYLFYLADAQLPQPVTDLTHCLSNPRLIVRKSMT